MAPRTTSGPTEIGRRAENRSMTCHNCGSPIPARRRGDLHSQGLCAACTTAYAWGYLAAERRTQTTEPAPSLRRWFHRRATRGSGAETTSDAAVPVDGRWYDTLL